MGVLLRAGVWAGLMLWAGVLGVAQEPAAPPGTQQPAGRPETPQEPAVTTLRARTSLVLVPALVETKDKKPVFTLQAEDFELLDDGVAQMRRIWAGEPPFEGADPVGPPPVQAGGPPLVAGVHRQGCRCGAQPLPAGGEPWMQRHVGHFVLTDPTQLGAFPVRHGVQQFAGVGDDRGVGPIGTAGAEDFSRDHRRPHAEPRAGQAGFFESFTHGRLLGSLVAVAGTAWQAPGSALMTPRRPVLQKHRRAAVGARCPQQ